jgi:hypothetical protein
VIAVGAAGQDRPERRVVVAVTEDNLDIGRVGGKRRIPIV